MALRVAIPLVRGAPVLGGVAAAALLGVAQSVLCVCAVLVLARVRVGRVRRR